MTNKEKNNYLKTKSKYYIAGWCDGEQDADIIIHPDSPEYQDYLNGYTNAKDNEYGNG